MAAVVNVMVKRRGVLITSCVDERDECKRTADDASKSLDGIKAGELQRRERLRAQEDQQRTLD